MEVGRWKIGDGREEALRAHISHRLSPTRSWKSERGRSRSKEPLHAPISHLLSSICYLLSPFPSQHHQCQRQTNGRSQAKTREIVSKTSNFCARKYFSLFFWLDRICPTIRAILESKMKIESGKNMKQNELPKNQNELEPLPEMETYEQA